MVADNIDEQDLPLDPATERVRRKLTRLLIVSIGIMMVGLMTVLGAVVYKVMDKSTPKADPSTAMEGLSADSGPLESTLDLPGGSEVKSATLDGSNILLHIAAKGEADFLLVYGIAEGRVLARVILD
jgi:hypothetical protein